MQVVLVRPQIATNTGNIIRLCANVGASLHLVEPLGFSLDSSSLRRAGLDYHELTNTTVHPTFDDALAATATLKAGAAYALTGHADRLYCDVDYNGTEVLVFGTERTGLGGPELARFDADHRLRIPMRPHNRSLNLANAVAVVTYEVWRQRGFHGAADAPAAGDAAATTSEGLRDAAESSSSPNRAIPGGYSGVV